MDIMELSPGNIFHNVTLSFWTNATRPKVVLGHGGDTTTTTTTTTERSKVATDSVVQWTPTTTTTTADIDLVSDGSNLSTNTTTNYLNWAVSNQLRDTIHGEEVDGVVHKLSDAASDYDYYGGMHNATNCSVWSNWTEHSGPTLLEDCLTYPIECLQFCLNHTASEGPAAAAAAAAANRSTHLADQSGADWLGHPEREYWALFLIILPILALFGNILVILR